MQNALNEMQNQNGIEQVSNKSTENLFDFDTQHYGV